MGNILLGLSDVRLRNEVTGERKLNKRARNKDMREVSAHME
jgi:hypothetical protein